MIAPRRIRKPMPLKGYRPSWPADQIGQDYTPNCRNVRFRFGEARSGPGRAILSGSVDPSGDMTVTSPQEIVQFNRLDGITTWPLLLTKNRLFRFGMTVPGTPEQWYNIGGNVPLAGGFRPYTASGEDQFFFCNGDTLCHWDGVVGHKFDAVTATDSGTVPKARFITYFNNRLVAAFTIEGANTWANRIRWAQNGDYTKWNDTNGLGAGFLDVVDDNQEAIKGIAGISGEVAIYTRRSIKHLVPTGTLAPTFAVQTRQHGIGCDAPYTIGSNGQLHFFLGYDSNVWSWDGLGVNPVGAPIWDELRAVVMPQSMNTYYGKCFPTREEYWLVIGNDVFVYDYVRGSWSRDTLPGVTAISEVDRTFNAKRWVDLVGQWLDQTQTWLELGGFTAPTLFGAKSTGETMMIDDSVAYDYFAIGSIMDRFLETEDMYLGQYQGLDFDPMRQGVVLRQLLVYKFVNDEPFEVGISTDRGMTWLTQQITPVDCGVSLIDWIVTGETIRFRFRENNTMGRFRWSSYEYEWQDAGDYIGSGTCPTGSGAVVTVPEVVVPSGMMFTLTMNVTTNEEPPVSTESVTSDVGGIACPGVCSAVFASNTVVTLTPHDIPAETIFFAGWLGDVPVGHESDFPLMITMDQDRTITCLFSLGG